MLQPTITHFHQEEWLEIIRQPLQSRIHYEKTKDHFKYSHVVAQFLGVKDSKNHYFDQLYDLANDSHLFIHVLHEELKREIRREHLQAIYQLYWIHQDQSFSSRRIVAFLERFNLLPTYQNKILDRHIRQSFVEVLEAYAKKYTDGLNADSFRRVLTDLIKWTWNQFDPWLKESPLDKEVPRVLWYGEMNESHRYFLYFLMKMGWDLLIFQPNGIDSFSMLDTPETKDLIRTYPKKIELKPFPKHRSQQATVAYQASETMDKILHHDDSGLYKLWQFKDHISYSVPLKTTYDELFLLIKEPAFIRPNFQIQDSKIHIPVLFAKIAGMTNEKDEYWDHINQITEESEITIFVKNFPFATNQKTTASYYYDSLGRNGRLDSDKIISNKEWKYKDLPKGLQLGIASAIIRYSENPLLKPVENESQEVLKQYLFSQAVSLPNQIIRLLQNFDYTQKVPRLVFYHTENNGEFSRADAALLLFFMNLESIFLFLIRRGKTTWSFL